MATILDLLMALNRGDLPPLPRPAPSAPIPYAPVPDLGPLSTDTALAFGAQNPEPVPPRFIEPAPVDQNFVSQQTGAPPTAPAPLSRGERILNAIAGFGAGLQGRGGEFLEQLREPQREYQRQVERYQGRQAQITELAERRAEREADRANRAAELQYNRDYNLYLKKLGIRKDEADTRTQQAFEIYKLDRHEKAEAAKEREREQRARESDARVRTGRFFTLTKDMAVSSELGRYYAGLSDKPLSAAAAKWDAKLQQVGEAQTNRSLRVGRGGGAGGGKLVEQFENLKRQLYPARDRGDETAVNNIMRRIEAVGAKLQAKGYEVGYGDNPYQLPPRGTAPAPAVQQGASARSLTDQFINPGYIDSLLAPVQQPQTATEEQLRQYAKENKISVKVARDDFQKAGIQVQRK